MVKKIAALGGRRYPWAKWFLKDRFTLKVGRDFNGHAYTMAEQVRRKAYQLGRRVKVTISSDQMALTVSTLKGPLRSSTRLQPGQKQAQLVSADDVIDRLSQKKGTSHADEKPQTRKANRRQSTSAGCRVA